MEYFTDTHFAKYCNQRLYENRGRGYPLPLLLCTEPEEVS
jgi:hypothetical protein